MLTLGRGRSQQIVQPYLQKNDGIEPASVQGVCMDDTPAVDEITGIIIFLCDVDIHALLNAFRCSTCDCYFDRTGNLELHLTICQKRVKQVESQIVCSLQETLFGNLENFNMPYTDEQQLFRSVAIFGVESICVPEDGSKNTDGWRQQDGSENLFRYLYQSPRTYHKIQFSFATLTRVI